MATRVCLLLLVGLLAGTSSVSPEIMLSSTVKELFVFDLVLVFVHFLAFLGVAAPIEIWALESLSLSRPMVFPERHLLMITGKCTTSHSDHSLPDYEAFCFDVDHIEEKSSGSTTSHSDLSLLEYESFYFDLSINPLLPADRSDSHHEEFADELAHIISPPKYDHFYFDLEDDPGELTRLLKENISDTSTKDLTIHELNDFLLLLSDCDSIFSRESFEIELLVSLPSKNKDKIFDLGIFNIDGVHSMIFPILLLNEFSPISFISDLLLTDPSEIETFLSFPSRNEDKVFDLNILLINGVFSFTSKSPHLLIDNFMIDKCHILSEISLKIESSVSFHPKDKGIRGESS
ncbi:hypothetical protein Tco_0019701 [Tanacetum coccineum]